MSEFGFITSRPGIAYLFPGQGSQVVGMGADLAQAYEVARLTFEEADDALGFALSELCFEGPEDALTDTINAQPALLAMSVAALRSLVHELGGAVRPDASAAPIFAAGHSMGEYTALVAAGAMSYTDGLHLVRERGRLMKQAGEENPGMMAAVLGLDEEQVRDICDRCEEAGDIVRVANDNCPGQVVISGDKPGMKCAMAALQEAGARKVVPLAVSIASHSPLMQTAVAGLSRAIAATQIDAPSVPVIGNTTASPMLDADAIRTELADQLTGPVRWTESMRFALAQGVTDFVEIGSGQVLAGLMKRTEKTAVRHSVYDAETLKAFAVWLAEGAA